MKYRSKQKKLLMNTVFSLAVFILFLAAMEVILGLYGFGKLCIYEPDRKLFWKPLPNQRCQTKVNQKPVYINSQGTRGNDFSKSKPDNALRIISLGDSRTFGWGLGESDTYSGLLEHLLQTRVGDTGKIEVINAGVNGWSFAQMYGYLKNIGLDYNPDMVILSNANLYTQFSEDSSKEFVDAFMIRVRLKNLLRRSAIYHFFVEIKLKKYYEKYRTLFIPVDPEKDNLFKSQQKSDYVRFFKEQISKFIELLQEYNVKGILIYIPREGEEGEKKTITYKIMYEASREYNIPLVDITNDFLNCKNTGNTCYLPADSVHPNIEGNRIIANTLFNVILNDAQVKKERWAHQAQKAAEK